MLYAKGGIAMPEYFFLFNSITDAIRALERLIDMLKAAQLAAEEAYISRAE